jgi:hypothetical protein
VRAVVVRFHLHTSQSTLELAPTAGRDGQAMAKASVNALPSIEDISRCRISACADQLFLRALSALLPNFKLLHVLSITHEAANGDASMKGYSPVGTYRARKNGRRRCAGRCS